MNIEVITREDLQQLKLEILREMSKLLNGKEKHQRWLKSTDIRKLLGISNSTLQNLRMNGTLPFTKLGGTLYYRYEDILQLLEKNYSASE